MVGQDTYQKAFCHCKTSVGGNQSLEDRLEAKIIDYKSYF
jgi:hypothetical protein